MTLQATHRSCVYFHGSSKPKIIHIMSRVLLIVRVRANEEFALKMLGRHGWNWNRCNRPLTAAADRIASAAPASSTKPGGTCLSSAATTASTPACQTIGPPVPKKVEPVESNSWPKRKPHQPKRTISKKSPTNTSAKNHWYQEKIKLKSNTQSISKNLQNHLKPPKKQTTSPKKKTLRKRKHQKHQIPKIEALKSTKKSYPPPPQKKIKLKPQRNTKHASGKKTNNSQAALHVTAWHHPSRQSKRSPSASVFRHILALLIAGIQKRVPRGFNFCVCLRGLSDFSWKTPTLKPLFRNFNPSINW